MGEGKNPADHKLLGMTSSALQEKKILNGGPLQCRKRGSSLTKEVIAACHCATLGSRE